MITTHQQIAELSKSERRRFFDWINTLLGNEYKSMQKRKEKEIYNGTLCKKDRR